MVRKLVHQMLPAQIWSALTISMCVLIDNLIIGHFWGERALMAYGFSIPVFLAFGNTSSILSTGAQVACSKSLGRGDREQTDIGYSSAIVLGVLVSVFLMLQVILFQVPIARLLGATEASLLTDTSGYITGISIGAPASIVATILIPFMQLAGQNTLLIIAMLGMTVTNIAFDLLNVFVFHGGMFGIGLATALSYYVAIIICSVYFLSKKCVFTFSPSRIQLKKIRELIANGVPLLYSMVSWSVMIFAVNRILLSAGSEAAVAAFSVIITIMYFGNCISSAIANVTLMLSGILYTEEDRKGLSELARTMAKSSVVLGLVVMSLLMLVARPCVELFIPNAGDSQAMAIQGLRIYSTGLVFCCLNYFLKNGYLGVGKARMMEAISVFQNAILPILTAFLFCHLVGVNATWFLYLASEALTLLGILCFVAAKRGGLSSGLKDILLLSEDFGVSPENLFEVNPSTLEDVMIASRKAEEFCLGAGGSNRLASHLALCIEEMGGNIVTHGFAVDKQYHLSIRLQHKDDVWTLRFRDDCMAFDPLQHISNDYVLNSLGIRLAMNMADEARYTYSTNLNNLMLVLRESNLPE